MELKILGTTTGRMSCTDKNVTNLPKDDKNWVSKGYSGIMSGVHHTGNPMLNEYCKFEEEFKTTSPVKFGKWGNMSKKKIDDMTNEELIDEIGSRQVDYESHIHCLKDDIFKHKKEVSRLKKNTDKLISILHVTITD